MFQKIIKDWFLSKGGEITNSGLYFDDLITNESIKDLEKLIAKKVKTEIEDILEKTRDFYKK